MYVRISHSEPFPNPTGLPIGTAGYVSAGIALGAYRGENSFSDLQIPMIPILVFGKINQSGFPKEVERSRAACKGYVKLKSLW